MKEGKISVRSFKKLTENHTINYLYKISTIHTNWYIFILNEKFPFGLTVLLLIAKGHLTKGSKQA